ncbi:hypothetical protein B9Z55_026064 [Caenorhabditis nigoni]|uniref:Uncharacterized protein n=1 Tax=Caenorhabditis nigoni TaxID=1611254 RepID=A0A2G5T1R6_9PELO|nr:hypothetical protein B9Z55_026064 [Caenorhabditis nigoni]
MNIVLESWIAGRNRDMEIGEIELVKFSDLNCDIIFTNIRTHATQLTEAEMDSLVDSSTDVLRESDALRATVIEATTRLHQE